MNPREDTDMDIPAPPLRDMKRFTRTINPRFRLFEYDKDAILALLEAAREGASLLSSREYCMLALLWGCAWADARVQEYLGEISMSDIYRFFSDKRAAYRLLLGHQGNAASEDSIRQAVFDCRELRELIPGEYIRLAHFDGAGARVKEEYILRTDLTAGTELATDLHQRMAALALVEHSEGATLLQNIENLISVFHESLRCHIEEHDVIVSTVPRSFLPGATDALDFSCYIDQGKAGFLSRYKMIMIGAVLKDLKQRERAEVREEDYLKPYANLSLYHNADAEHEVHQYLGMNSAARYILDLRCGLGMIFGLADVRIMRPAGVRALGKPELGWLFLHGEVLKVCLEEAIANGADKGTEID